MQESTQEMICEVEWDSIRVSPFQPRRIFSEEELEELAASIREVGIIQPPVVRMIMNRDKLLYYELIAGERRWRAAKKAGFSKLKVIVRKSNEEEAAKATLIENLQRIDLNPLETAQAFKRLIDVFHMTQEEVAEKVGKKRSTVANYLRVLGLPKEIQEGISKGTITMGHAKAILSLDGQELQESLHAKIMTQNLTVREAERESATLSKQIKKPSSVPAKEIHLRSLEEKLQESLGTKVIIEHAGKKGGKVMIHYYSLEDLDRLLDLMNASIGTKPIGF